MSEICSRTMWITSIPLTILLVAFFSLTGYVIYSFHVFHPIAPRIDLPCTQLSNRSSPTLVKYLSNRTLINETPVDKNCFKIRLRRYLPQDIPKSISGNHNMLFIRVVSKDYDFVEEVLTMMHSPIHFFCFALDESADEVFKKRMFILGDCLVNVLVIRELFNTSTSHGLLKAHERCLKEIDSYEWKHAIITAEKDVPLHSAKFLARRSRRLRDMVEINGMTFKEDILQNVNPNDTSSQLFVVTKNWIQHLCSVAIISHSQHERFYDYLLKTPDFSLASEKHQEINVLEENCASKKYDVDGSCIFAMENFPTIRNLSRLFIRSDPHFDNGFVNCLQQIVYERTFFSPISNFNAKEYIFGSN